MAALEGARCASTGALPDVDSQPGGDHNPDALPLITQIDIATCAQGAHRALGRGQGTGYQHQLRYGLHPWRDRGLPRYECVQTGGVQRAQRLGGASDDLSDARLGAPSDAIGIPVATSTSHPLRAPTAQPCRHSLQIEGVAARGASGAQDPEALPWKVDAASRHGALPDAGAGEGGGGCGVQQGYRRHPRPHRGPFGQECVEASGSQRA
mmetsp:Transcript_4614/g.12278  ORF Transcript_4614/g.12278 Transcript_4614/m.12278 type:complete len:209 (-) Transcript_4614:531-1157(-)